ncbi:NERD domain-containing protein [Caballeronia glebae]|uniref:NERD domain-containing protein n=1 Tax=Caballeronia glebae TaxID=1777143 RepID=A0A158DPF7_9BURK|nr:nuclease-related domain-containing protein [Caballeronia glebae]SAK96076.1 NERD domain-containing protein [Caballeronia glebae]
MFFEMLVAVGGYRVFKAIKQRSRSRPRSAHRAKRSSDDIGAAGEALAQAKLRTTLEWLCGDNFYLHEGTLLIEHAPGTAFPTAEIDHLAITPFGVFVFETKNWSGRIAPSNRPDTLTRTAPNGKAEDRRSPIEQNRSKIRFLREQLPAMWPVAGAGLFVSPGVILHPELPTDLLALDDLPHWLRSKRAERTGTSTVDVAKAREAVLMYADASTEGFMAHKVRTKRGYR